MRTFLFLFRRPSWRMIVVLALLIMSGVAYAASPYVRDQSHHAWHATWAWVGIGGDPVDSDTVYWCPMDPQIKRTNPNDICPICNMALVELEGGVVEPPQHLTLTARQVQQAGVAVEPVIRRKLMREVDTTGRIAYDERRLAKITSWVRGKSRIEKLHVNYRGIEVEQGDPLVELYSPELVVAQQSYLSSLRREEQRSGESNVPSSPRATLNVTGATNNQLRPQTQGPSVQRDLIESGRQNLKYQGLSDRQIDELTESRQVQDRIPIAAPMRGTVHQRNVVEGEYVSEGDVLVELVDLSHMWVFADIFEEELPLVNLGLPVEITVEHLPDEVFRGKIAFIDHATKPGTRTVPVRIDVPNPDLLLKSGMFARVRFRHDWPSVLAVPENAVMFSGQRSVVMVDSGSGSFEPRQVQLGRKWMYSAEDESDSDDLGFGDGSERYHEVLAGLSPGERVVTAGAFLLSAESQFQSVLTKMLPPESQRATLEEVLGKSLAGSIRDLLDAYFQLSRVLADDELEAVPARLAAVEQNAASLVRTASESEAEELRTAAERFADLVDELNQEAIADAEDARTRFGRISHELTKLLHAHGGQTLFGKELYQFECGMADVGYERWLWWGPELHNPYMGQKMLKCGTQLDVFEP